MDLTNSIPAWLKFLKTCESTNSWALEQGDFLSDGDVVFTRQQTAGRGQFQRSWCSPAGVLTASFILHNFPVSQLSYLSLLSGLAVVYAVEELLPQLKGKLQLKWPNDVWLNRQKVAGILCETRAGVGGRRVIIGIGLNYQVDLVSLGLVSAISLHQVCPEVPSDLAFLKSIRFYLQQVQSLLLNKPEQWEKLWQNLLARDGLLHKDVTIQLGEEIYTGIGCGLDQEGRFLLQISPQQIKAFNSGTIISYH